MYFFILCLIIVLIFIISHLQPLTDIEIEILANKRRNKDIRIYFSFTNYEFVPNSNFKKKLIPNGTFYRIGETRREFPSIAASLLKYKKHEWIIISFGKDNKVELLWINKGFDRATVIPHLSPEAIIQIAEKECFNYILIFHNHPNSNPNYYSCIKPSEQDLHSAKHYANALNSHNINLLEFVCERGKHYEYFISPAANFMPLNDYVLLINNLNNKSKYGNLKLHIEKIMQKGIIFNQLTWE